MAKIIDEAMFDDMLSSGPRDWFAQKEEDGEVRIVFTTPIAVVNPGDTDLSEREWNPPVADANGEPYLEKYGPNKGNPVIPWTKVEAQCTIKGIPKTYSFGRQTGSCLRHIMNAMRENDIKNDKLPGTKWSVTRSGSYDWKVEYLGREEIESSPSKEDPELIGKIKQTLNDVKSKNKEISTTGVSKEQIIQTVNLLAGIPEEDIKDQWHNLMAQKLLERKGDMVIIC